MKVSALIRKLQKIEAEHGDLEVLHDDDAGYCFEITDVTAEKGDGGEFLAVITSDEPEGDGEPDVIETTGRRVTVE